MIASALSVVLAGGGKAENLQPRPGEGPDWTVLDQRPGQGERCLVCGRPIRGDDVVELRYRGRTFFVAAAMLGDFEGDPEGYFRKLEARSGLFDEDAQTGRPVATGWLILGLYVLTGLLFAAGCGYLAVSKALGPIPWFFAGLVGNVAALVVLWVTPRGDASALVAGIPGGLAKVPATREPALCPGCSRPNHPAAAECSACGADLKPAVVPETARVHR